MKNTLNLTVVSLFLSACASSSGPSLFRPAASKNDYGYWEEKLQDKGAFMVHANMPSGWSEDRKHDFLALRLAKLCQERGRNYFELAGGIRGPMVKLAMGFDGEEFEALGFCYSGNYRRTLGFEGDTISSSLRVLSVPEGTAFKMDDEILEVNGREVKEVDDIRLAVYALPDSAESADVKVLRGDAETKIRVKLVRTYKYVHDLQSAYFFEREFN